MKEVLSNLFNEILLNTPEDLHRIYYFLLSKVGPEYKSPELGIGTGILEKVVAKAIGKSDKHIKEKMVELGDLALVAMEGKKTLGTMEKFQGFVTNNNKKDMTLKNVMDNFVDLANIKGKSSQAEKEKILVKLLFNANKEEVKYIIRSLQKGLKIGASLKTIVAALARTISRIYSNTSKIGSKSKSNLQSPNTLDEKEAERIILISMNQLCDEDIVFKNLIDVITARNNFSNLIEICKITPGVPVKPQLARPTTGLKVIFQRFDGVPFTCEYKYDGFRGQVHHYAVEKPGSKITYKTEIFSRNLENMTDSYPDIVEYLEKIHSEKVNSFILDCEIVAFDSKNGKILPFHQLTTRARKNVIVKEISINVCMFVFDILYLNNEIIIEKTLEERRNILRENFEETEKIQIAKSVSSDKFEEIEGFMNEAIAAGNIINDINIYE
jgi:DNA ligase-1